MISTDGRVASSSADAGVSPRSLLKELNLFDSIAVVVGTIIGSGIFLIPSSIAAQLDSLGAVLLVWFVGGVLTLFGALSLAELGAMYPRTGGLCTYLRQAYGPLPAFLYAWALLLIIHSGSIAALAVAFGLFAGQVMRLSPFEKTAVSDACILVLTTINCLGIRGGKLVQNLIAVAKVGGLAGMISLLCLRGSRTVHFFETAANTRDCFSSLAGFGIALVAVLWTYEGWHVVSFVAGEMKRPRVDLPRSLLCGSVIVILVYLVANVGYYHVLSPAEIQDSEAVAALAVGKVMGVAARKSISLLILVSILGSLNGMLMTGPRVYYAMARGGVFPRAFGLRNGRYHTPMLALIVQGVWAAVLATSGSYQQLFTSVIFTAWIFYGLAVAAVLVLRRGQPELERPFCVLAYPWVPLLFCTAVVGLVLDAVIERPGSALIGIALIGSGVPVYIALVKSNRRLGSQTVVSRS